MEGEKKQSSERKSRKKTKAPLSLYRSKTIAKGKQLTLDLKRRSHCEDPISPMKLPKLVDSTQEIYVKVPDDINYSQRDIRQHDLHIKVDPVTIEGDNLCDPVPPASNNNSGIDNNKPSLKDNAHAILSDQTL